MIRKPIIIVLTLAAGLTLVLGAASYFLSAHWLACSVPDAYDWSLRAGLREGTLSITCSRRAQPSEHRQYFDWHRYGLRISSYLRVTGLQGADAELGESRIEAPFWLAAFLLSTYPLVVFVRGPMRRWHRSRSGLCLCCGYDLTGNVTGICSECGATLDTNDIPAATPSARPDEHPRRPLCRRGSVRRCVLTGTSFVAIATLLFGLLSYGISNTLSASITGNTGAWMGGATFGFAGGHAQTFCGDSTGRVASTRVERKLWELSVPFWIPLLVFGLYPAVALIRGFIRRRQPRGSETPPG